MLAAGLRPLEPFPGSAKPWRCEHACGRVVSPTYNHIQQGRGGCSVCARKEVDPEIVMATMFSAGLTPLELFPGSAKPWRCHHECGREIHPRYTHIQQGQGGCKFCAVRLFKPELDAHLYFLEHPERDLYQIGVSNRIKGRLTTHTRSGWNVIDVSPVMPGDVAYQYEQDGRKAIKSRGGCFTDLLGNEKSGGYSEVWTRKSFRPKSLTELIQMVDEDRSKSAA